LPPALPKPLLRTTASLGFHLLSRKPAEITRRHGVAGFRESLLSAESEFLVLLLPFGCCTACTACASWATTASVAALVAIVDGDVEEVVIVIGGTGSVSLALCCMLELIKAKKKKKERE
jgi:threonine dehydrogenase-like Zn-dependent dehydrogenase